MSFPNCLPGKPAWIPTPEEKLEIEKRKALVKAESLEAKRVMGSNVGNSGHRLELQSSLFKVGPPSGPRVYRYRGPRAR